MTHRKMLDEHDKLRQHADDGGHHQCRYCGLTRWCLVTDFYIGFWSLQRDVYICQECLLRLTQFAYSAPMEKFLRDMLVTFGQSVEWHLNYEREKVAQEAGLEQYGRKAKEWAEALGLLYRAMFNGFRPEGNAVAVAKALRAFTGLDVVKGRQFVDKVFAEQRAALLSAPAPEDPMARGRRIAADLVGRAGANAPAQKIVIIKQVRDATGLSLKEAKDVVDAAMATQVPKPANGVPAPTTVPLVR